MKKLLGGTGLVAGLTFITFVILSAPELPPPTNSQAVLVATIWVAALYLATKLWAWGKPKLNKIFRRVW